MESGTKTSLKINRKGGKSQRIENVNMKCVLLTVPDLDHVPDLAPDLIPL
jgi:hypothetical protein